MELTWQTTKNTTYPYLWCHGCNAPLEAGLFIQCIDYRVNPAKWMRLCPMCLDQINTYMIGVVRAGELEA